MMLTYAEIKPIQNNKVKAATVFFVIDDMTYLTGEICKKKDGGGYFMSVANAPWKGSDEKWHNKYLAGILDDDVKTKLEDYIISLYTSNTFEFKTANMAKYLQWKAKFNKAPKAATSTTAPAGMVF